MQVKRRRHRRARGLSDMSCKIGESIRERMPDLIDTGCLTDGRKTLCVGDRVVRADIKVAWAGQVMALGTGRTNKGAKKKSAIVCEDGVGYAYPYLFSELKKK